MTRKAAAVLFYSLMLVAVMTSMNQGLRAAELAPHLYRTTLENGLTVVVKETPGGKVATVQLWVRAGSVYEEPDEAGITHFIEHMIFKGTPTRGPGELAGAIESLGGRVNAYTTYDYTAYHATLSARHWTMALEVLADAVRNSVFAQEEVEREKKVVLEELWMRNDRPNIKLFQKLMSTVYTRHPYRLPVIGNEESIRNFNREKIVDYLDKHYHPENLVVVVVGDIKTGEVTARVRELLGDMAPGGTRRPVLPAEPPMQRPVHFVLTEEINQPQMALALPISRFDNPDTPVLDVIAQILGQGETSRLYRAVRNEKQLVYGISSSAFTPRDPGLFEINALVDGEKLLPALQSTLVELFKLKYQSVTSEELQRAKRSLESDFVFNMERVEGQARVLGSFELLTGDPREDEYLEQIRRVTMDDIKRVAGEYFVGQHLAAGFLVGQGSGFSLGDEQLPEVIRQAEQEAQESESASLLPDAYLSRVHRFRLDNGMTLLVREDDTVPAVSLRAVFPGGLRAETAATNGAFAFISEMLTKGTAGMNAQEIAEAVADMAGSLNGYNGKNTFGVKGEFLARFLPQGLELARDVLMSPAFPEEETEKIRPELLAQLKQQEDSLTSLAIREFNRLLFEGHPYGLNSIGTEEVITGITTARLKEIYARHALPDRLVLAVAGDVDAEEVRDQVTTLFGDWTVGARQGVSEIEEDLLVPEPPPEPRTERLVREKEQVHLVLGFLGATMASEDRYGLEVLETVLSGQSGRLFTELRDRQSLAYSLSSFSLFGLDTGAFGMYMGTSPDKKEQAVSGMWRELKRVREQLISDEELRRAQNILISQYEMGLQTHAAQALEMALNENYGLGHDFGNRYVERISAVDARTVREMAEKYILPEHYVLVSVGAASAAEEEASTDAGPPEEEARGLGAGSE